MRRHGFDQTGERAAADRDHLVTEEAEPLVGHAPLGPPPALSSAAMARLQRSAGNAAVVHLLAGGHFGEDSHRARGVGGVGRAGFGRAQIQLDPVAPAQKGVGKAATEAAAKLAPRDVTLTDKDLAFWGVLEYGVVLMVDNAGLNESARRLVAHMKDKVRPTSERFLPHYQNLGFVASDLGPDDIEAVKAPDVQAKLEKAMKGKSGDRLRGFVKDFVNSHDELAKELKLYDASKHGYEAATLELKKETLEKRKTEKTREKEEAEGAVAARKKEIEKQTKYAEAIIDAGFKLTGGPAKAAEAGLDLLKFATKEVVKAMLADDPKLKQAEENLKEAKAALQGVEDEVHATAIAAAAKRVKEAEGKMDAAWIAVKSAAKKCVQAQVPLTEALDTMGLTEVGTAMADRQWVMGEAEQATTILAEYEGLVRPVGKEADTLKRLYWMLGDGMSTPGGEMTIPDPAVREELKQRCEANVDTAQKISDWQAAEMAKITEIRADIAKGDWLKPFETIDEILQGLLAGGGASAPIP